MPKRFTIKLQTLQLRHHICWICVKAEISCYVNRLEEVRSALVSNSGITASRFTAINIRSFVVHTADMPLQIAVRCKQIPEKFTILFQTLKLRHHICWIFLVQAETSSSVVFAQKLFQFVHKKKYVHVPKCFNRHMHQNLEKYVHVPKCFNRHMHQSLLIRGRVSYP